MTKSLKKLLILMTAALLLSAIFCGVITSFANNKTIAATPKNFVIASLDYVGTKMYMYSDILLRFDGDAKERDGVIYTNTTDLQFTWTKTKTNFTSTRNMGINGVVIYLYSDAYASGIIPIKTYTDAPKFATRLENELLYEKNGIEEGRYRIVWNATFESFGTEIKYNDSKYIVVDRTSPTGYFTGASSGDYVGEDESVAFYWADAPTGQAPIEAKLNGNSYTKGSRFTFDGGHNIELSDYAGNIKSYSLDFYFDKTRPYISNIDSIAAAFKLSDKTANTLKSGQEGELEIDIGAAVPGVEFSFADNSTAGGALSVTVIQNLYNYDLTTGIASGMGQSSYSASSNIKLDKPGYYQITVKDKFNIMLRLNFSLKVDVKFSPEEFTLKGDKYILGNKSLASIISILGSTADNAFIQIDGVDIAPKLLTIETLIAKIASKPEREKVAIIKIISRYKGVETVYFDSQICLDFSGADIHNLRDLDFNGGSGSYLGLSKQAIYFEFGGLPFELDERAELFQTLYAYDNRNVLYIKEEERKIDYISGTTLSEYGYYVLKINDGYRVTEYSFKILGEFKSRNEFMLGYEYFISPTYNVVKFPLSFGTFNIQDDSNIDTKYIGKYFADKKYLFNSKLQTAYDFAFAAEYSVCVQRTSSGYLYRARNQGIQVAYNDFAQLKMKIKEVVKEYVTYKSMKLLDSSNIDYTSTIIMDEELKQNGRYENVGAVEVGGITYNKVMLINKDFVFKFNNGKDEQSGKAKIKVTNLETNQIFDVSNGMMFGEFSALNGLYLVEEFCPGSTETLVYYVYLDNVAPTANISSAKATGVVIEQTISAADTIVLQVKEFNLVTLFDLIDNFCLASINGYGFSDAIPIVKGENANIKISSDMGHKGAYEIEVYDRSKNRFKFIVYIMGQEPTATFTKIGTGDTERVILDIQTSDKYCMIIGLKIYRNQTSVTLGELLEDDNGQAISFAVSSYMFKKGGRYKIVIVDNYERETLVELRYVKDMPNISAEGLNKERRVNKEIRITIPYNCLFIIFAEKNSIFIYEILNDTINNERIITIKPRNDYNELVAIDDKITIKAWFESDPDSYNDLSYYLDTIAPSLNLANEKGDDVDGSLFKFSIKLKFDADIKTMDVTRNGKYFSYTLGQAIRLDGQYSAVGKDIAGNVVVKEFVIDMLVDYVISYENNKKYNSSKESGVVAAQGFLITPNEQMTISATKDGFLFDYLIVDKIMTAGLYEITMQDNAGNVELVKIRVLSGIEGIGIYNEDGSLLTYNSVTRQSIYFVWQELSYIKTVTYKTNTSGYESTYASGELLIKSAAYTIIFTDCVGNVLEIKCRVDKDVSIEIKLDKSANLDEIAGEEHLLTLRFKILVDESGLNITIKKDGQTQQFQIGTWLDKNGTYEIEAEDEVGNILKKWITVIGESNPKVTITTNSDKELTDKNVINEPIQISWGIDDYISKVFVNSEAIKSGERFVKDGRYRIEITDKLGREATVTITIKSQIGYSIKFNGEFLAVENEVEITLTRGFNFSSDDTLEIAATHNGENFTLVSYRAYSLPGEYRLSLKDVAGNMKNISIRVVAQAFLPNIYKSNGNEILNNSVINSGFYITKNMYIYTIKVNDVLYEDGIILVEGKNKIDVEDVVGYKTTLYITIDTQVKYTLQFGKTFDKLNCVLTDKFMITPEEEMSVTLLLNGQAISYVNKYYTATGLYEIELEDTLGNIAKVVIEVDNTAPKVNIKNLLGEDILSNVTNQTFVINWSDSDNIYQVFVNGNIIERGARYENDGAYEIRITSLLDKVNTQTITINHKISYELYLKNDKSFEFIKNEVNYTLAIGFSLSGSQVSNIECAFEGQAIAFEKDKTYISSGIYELIITDIAGNIAYLNIVVSDKALAGGIAIDEEKVYGNRTINKDFSIVQNEFVAQINVNGGKYLADSIIEKEGIYTIEYIDVLGRKSSQIIKVDKSVTMDVEYTKIKNIDGEEVYLNTKLLLTPKENLEIKIYLDGVRVEVVDVSKPILISGLYTIYATDDCGNMRQIILIVDNQAPDIKTTINANNSVAVTITDKSEVGVSVYLNGKLFLENTKDFVLDRDGKFLITVVDELKNKSEMTIKVDMAVDVTYNFFTGQSINFKPMFTFNELVNYELYLQDEATKSYTLLKDYKLNGALADKGSYLIKLKDEQNNSLDLTFVYHGASSKLAATKYHLPTVEGLIYKVLFENQPIEIEEESGILNLDKTGKYEIIFTINNKEISFYLEILNDPPSLKIRGKFKSKENLKASGAVSIDADNFKLYFNGAEISSVSEVSKVGKYKVVATDSVGNVKEMEFEIYYALNGWSWFLIFSAFCVIGAIILMILKRKGILRIKIKKNKKGEKNGRN